MDRMHRHHAHTFTLRMLLKSKVNSPMKPRCGDVLACLVSLSGHLLLKTSNKPPDASWHKLTPWLTRASPQRRGLLLWAGNLSSSSCSDFKNPHHSAKSHLVMTLVTGHSMGKLGYIQKSCQLLWFPDFSCPRNVTVPGMPTWVRR